MRTRWISLALCLAALPASAQRLPAGVSPDTYKLWFAPDLARATFRGRESIVVRVAAPTSTITVNAAEITFDTVTITDGSGTQTASVGLNDKAETATFTVPRAVPAGTATIAITYTGILNDKLRGFYLSKANGRNYAVTQMEATDARRAFPCFDEPSYKATFDISLTIAAGDVAISNGRQLSDEPGPDPGTHTLTFATTPKMSSYLVAMLVGDFVCRSGAAGDTPIRVCATPDKLRLTAFALAAAEQQVAFYNQYLGIPYPFGKLDIVGIPDFAAGAMENAGAITFRERMLLADEATASLGLKQSVASVIAHELAHQWFGDLVTMKWWDDIWLNEGFATWAANKPLAAWRPEWKMDVNAAQETQVALGLDALRSTRAIRTKVETPDEINEVFDPIAYEKTAGVLGMLESFVGPEKFREGISSYLKKYSSGNAAGEDFWTEMTRVTEKPVNRIMKSFVDQPGAPALTVRTRCVGGSTEVTVKQRRFVGAPQAAGAAAPAENQVWTLPVCVKSATGQTTCEVVSQAEQTLRAPGCGATMVNADARGYYFTEYEPAALIALAKRVPPLTPTERVSLLGDEWRMMRAGRHDVGAYLDLAAAFAKDETPAVMGDIAARVAFVLGAIADSGQQAAFQGWMRAAFSPALEAIGLPGAPGDSDELQSRRGALLGLLGAAGDARVQRRARELAEGYLTNPASLPPTLVGSVLQVAASGGDAALYDRFAARLTASAGNPEEYYRFFGTLPTFHDPALVARTLAFSISPDVRTQDAPQLLGQLLGSPSSQEAAWSFLKTQWTAIVDKIGMFQGIPGIVGALGGFCSTERSAEIKAFFEAHPVPAAARGIQQALERIDACAAVRRRQTPAFASWLAARP